MKAPIQLVIRRRNGRYVKTIRPKSKYAAKQEAKKYERAGMVVEWPDSQKT
jgi:hypothetical protein